MSSRADFALRWRNSRPGRIYVTHRAAGSAGEIQPRAARMRVPLGRQRRDVRRDGFSELAHAVLVGVTRVDARNPCPGPGAMPLPLRSAPPASSTRPGPGCGDHDLQGLLAAPWPVARALGCWMRYPAAGISG